MHRFRLAAVAGAVSLAAAVGGPPSAHAQPAAGHHVIVAVDANQSTNWSGYNQGTLEQGNTLFDQVSGDWTVPAATQHTTGQDEFSSTWVGIGGGCVDAGCNVVDTTLIQAGTEQDVDSAGRASYSAWFELIPAPSLTITSLPVAAGDQIHVDIHEVVPNGNVWTITLQNLSTGKSFTTTVPYASTHATAEWIEETPLVFGTGGAGLAALPNLSTVHIDNALTNGARAGLRTSEQIQLVDSNNKPLATPSSPDVDLDGFNDCTWSSTCAAPTSS